ncbi:ribosome recycling factor [Patescibacteria group bacterium]|nr:ribosome recycling factor [Patescibacteria group bacterium]MBU2220101.1 ribosome recycling factor [Patescibacteria group bacterium]MBU2264869.1 ribosome recycling factor [Patescibacteria group bacterium]
MYKQIIDKIKPDIEKTMAHFKEEMGALRTGRATPALIETVEVECYNGRSQLRELAAINAPEPRILTVQPWDKSIMKEIEKAISQSRGGLAVVNSGDIIRVSVPSLNEETRKEFVRNLKQKMEEARIAVRGAREKAWKELQDGERSGVIREDDKFRGKDELQKVIDEYNKKIDEQGEGKEKEIMTI